ncbi:uncharacterized protein RSE6_09797 [Rhynchosporium secalis]|uniref:Uncharacterized protein n=1 Tax=Rhynchosporium secalis TaxID=38038 RepID=A0A1E1MIU8_RHYSE|nr:uncharacterized protein RSE6_09797 [Rhynchosporium secalis]
MPGNNEAHYRILLSPSLALSQQQSTVQFLRLVVPLHVHRSYRTTWNGLFVRKTMPFAHGRINVSAPSIDKSNNVLSYCAVGFHRAPYCDDWRQAAGPT